MAKRYRLRRRGKKGARLVKILTLIVVCVLAFPVGLAALYRYVPPPATPLMLIRVFQGEGIKKEWVPLKRISPYAVRAVIALEDTNFCEHNGVDWGELFSALSEYFKGQRMRGASTISMQTAKNVFLWPGRDLSRKALEAPLTFLIETLWDKRRIMEVYLNVAEWGPGIYGIEAASETYFGKSAAHLSAREAGLLAAVLPNPRRWSPRRPTAYISSRMHLSLARSAMLGSTVSCTWRRSGHA